MAILCNNRWIQRRNQASPPLCCSLLLSVCLHLWTNFVFVSPPLSDGQKIETLKMAILWTNQWNQRQNRAYPPLCLSASRRFSLILFTSPLLSASLLLVASLHFSPPFGFSPLLRLSHPAIWSQFVNGLFLWFVLVFVSLLSLLLWLGSIFVCLSELTFWLCEPILLNNVSVCVCLCECYDTDFAEQSLCVFDC